MECGPDVLQADAVVGLRGRVVGERARQAVLDLDVEEHGQSMHRSSLGRN